MIRPLQRTIQPIITRHKTLLFAAHRFLSISSTMEHITPVTPQKANGAKIVNTPSRTSARKRKQTVIITPEDSELSDPPESPPETPKPARKKRKVIKKETVVKEEEEELIEGAITPKKRVRKKTQKKKIETTAEPMVEGEGVPVDDAVPVKKKRTRKPKEPIVYVIPDVEKKKTRFKGRLGYACLNTILRVQKPPVFCSRTCRIDTIEKKGMEYLKDIGRQNIKDLVALIEWNEQNGIKFMRMSSEMFPFASHPKYGYDLSYCDTELKAAGDLAKKYGHRLTTHPGQFTQIASPKENVVSQSIKELEYHCEMIDRMGLDQDSIMIIHMGGVYGDKPATLERFKVNYPKLSDRVKARIVLENDEICYNVDDLLSVCPDLDIPIVLDYHHDWINPSTRPIAELIPIVNKTWIKKGIKPKQHLSEPRPGAETTMEKRAHADRCASLPAHWEIPLDAPPSPPASDKANVANVEQSSADPTFDDTEVDLMIEAKDKEQAVFELFRIYDLAPIVHWDNLRPPVPLEEQSKHTKGRKSAGKRKAKAEDDEQIEGVDPDNEEAPKKRKPRKKKVSASKEIKEALDEGILVPQDEEQTLDTEMVEALENESDSFKDEDDGDESD